MKKLFFVLMFIFMIAPFVSSAQTGSQETCECVNETIRISELTQTNTNLSQQVVYYSNLSDYYEESYLSQEVNITNRELIALTQHIYILNQNITDLHTEIGELKQEVTFFNLTLKLTISLLSLTILGALAKFTFKKWNIKQKISTLIFGSQ